MKDAQQVIIPTLSRAMISRNLSYPIGAEQLSAALAATSQLPDLKLHFSLASTLACEAAIMSSSELNTRQYPQRSGPISSLYKRPPQYRWEIVVQPVPRILRHRIKQYIVESALPQIALWLVERAQLEHRGNEILAFFYNEKTDEFIAPQLTHLEPLQR